MFDNGARLVEVYVLDFDDDLYDHVIEVQFIKRLREEMNFASVDALIAQIARDVEETRQVLGG
jgi:riboflavin kinase/FMN adenylyltransferase